MASQRITIAKIAGASADLALHRLGKWAVARKADDPSLWSSEQWPDSVRLEVDDFAEQLRAHGLKLPVVYFTEWSDMWSMGDLFQRWLMPPGGPPLKRVYGNRFEVCAYDLPDGGRLAQYLAGKEPQQWAESDWYIGRLREAAQAWQDLVPRAALVVLRYVVDASIADEQVEASLHATPDWLK